jgi:hypothetical protein
MIEDPKVRTYILERTRGFFVGRPDKPCSGGCTFGALLWGCALRARRLGHCSASDCCLNGGNMLPHPLAGLPSGLCDGRGWTLAPAGDEGHVNVRDSAALDKKRL